MTTPDPATRARARRLQLAVGSQDAAATTAIGAVPGTPAAEGTTTVTLPDPIPGRDLVNGVAVEVDWPTGDRGGSVTALYAPGYDEDRIEVGSIFFRGAERARAVAVRILAACVWLDEQRAADPKRSTS